MPDDSIPQSRNAGGPPRGRDMRAFQAPVEGQTTKLNNRRHDKSELFFFFFLTSD